MWPSRGRPTTRTLNRKNRAASDPSLAVEPLQKEEAKPNDLVSKILQHLKRVELHYLGNLSAGNRYTTDFPNKKLFRQSSKKEKRQYRLWRDKAFWMQHAAVQECSASLSLAKALAWIVRSDAFIRSWRKKPIKSQPKRE
jgi:hypothetical protein